MQITTKKPRSKLLKKRLLSGIFLYLKKKILIDKKLNTLKVSLNWRPYRSG